LGKNFKILNQLGLICLDSPAGLTSHPKFGTKGRTSDVRKGYKKSFLKWHESLGKYSLSSQYLLPFPHQPRLFSAPHEAAVPVEIIRENEKLSYEKNSYKLDVVIITDLRFPGGNASTTLDEVNTLLTNGFKVKIIHCPSLLSIRKQISERYFSYINHLHLNYYSLGCIEAKVVIVRNPSVIASPIYDKLIESVVADTTIYVVNNALNKASGESAYDFDSFLAGLTKSKSSNQLLFPLSNLIRNELLEQHKKFPDNVKIEKENWHPLFKVNDYCGGDVGRFEKEKIVIGRHSRDDIDKWPDQKEIILKVYPDNPDIVVNILGGVGSIIGKLDKLPENWNVYPYGSLNVKDFLSGLDFFVYFPSDGLKEAFGRVVMEAVFAGLPCILPRRFEETFGSLAYYCDAHEVQNLIKKLLDDKAALRCQVEKNRNDALIKFESSALLSRLHKYTNLYE
jgi:hypothetical protein